MDASQHRCILHHLNLRHDPRPRQSARPLVDVGAGLVKQQPGGVGLVLVGELLLGRGHQVASIQEVVGSGEWIGPRGDELLVALEHQWIVAKNAAQSELHAVILPHVVQTPREHTGSLGIRHSLGHRPPVGVLLHFYYLHCPAAERPQVQHRKADCGQPQRPAGPSGVAPRSQQDDRQQEEEQEQRRMIGLVPQPARRRVRLAPQGESREVSQDQR